MAWNKTAVVFLWCWNVAANHSAIDVFIHHLQICFTAKLYISIHWFKQPIFTQGQRQKEDFLWKLETIILKRAVNLKGKLQQSPRNMYHYCELKNNLGVTNAHNNKHKANKLNYMVLTLSKKWIFIKMIDVWLKSKASLFAFLSKLYTVLLHYRYFHKSYHHCTQS